jgi:hypothetical protein
MNYTVTSDVFTPKEKGESITEKELLQLGLNIDALVASGHIKNNAAIKPAEEVK